MTTKTLDRTRPPAAGHRRPPGFVSRWRARRAERDAWAAHHRLAQAVTAEFREACTALRLCHYVSVAAGVTVRTPRVGDVHAGPPMTLTVELMPGQEPGDFTSKRERAPPRPHPRRPRPARRTARRALGAAHRAQPRPAARRLRAPVARRRLRSGGGDPRAHRGRHHPRPRHRRRRPPRRCRARTAPGSPRSATGCSPSSPPRPTSSSPARTSPACCSAAPGTAPPTGPTRSSAPPTSRRTRCCSRTSSPRWTAGSRPSRRAGTRSSPRPRRPTVLVVLEEFPGLLRAADALPEAQARRGRPGRRPHPHRGAAAALRGPQGRVPGPDAGPAIRGHRRRRRLRPRPVRPAAELPGSGRLAGDAPRRRRPPARARSTPTPPPASPTCPGSAATASASACPYLGEYGEYVDRIQRPRTAGRVDEPHRHRHHRRPRHRPAGQEPQGRARARLRAS